MSPLDYQPRLPAATPIADQSAEARSEGRRRATSISCDRRRDVPHDRRGIKCKAHRGPI